MSGSDMQLATADKLRIHTSQSIGTLGGAVKPGLQGLGVQLIAGKDAIDVQAQADILNVQARDMVDVKSSNAHIDWAAAKKITLSTADGANITIEGGNITVQCPGKITVNAGKKVFTGPAQIAYNLPILPRSEPKEELINFKLLLTDVPGKHGQPLPERPWKIVALKNPSGDPFDPNQVRKELAAGISTTKGECVLSEAQKKALWDEVNMATKTTWLVSGPNLTPLSIANLTASASDKVERKILDAHNYAVSPEHVDQAHKMLLKQWGESDYESKLTGSPKNETNA
jgi:type VI secretion system secreted protein VgrG